MCQPPWQEAWQAAQNSDESGSIRLPCAPLHRSRYHRRGQAGRGHGAGRAETLQQRALAPRPDTGNFVQGIGADRPLALLAMAADGIAMGFVTQPLQIIEHRVFRIETERLFARHIEMLAAGIAVRPFGDADQRHILHPLIGEHLAGDAELSRAAIDDAVGVLGPEGSPDREVWRLMYVEDRPVAEVAELMGVPEGTVKSRAHRARRLLRAALRGGPLAGGTR